MKLLLLLFALTVSLSTAETFTGKVVGVADGDTLSVLREGKAVTIRLDSIDAPESHQAFGTKAKQYVSNAVFGKQVTVDVKGKDRYGRMLGAIVLPDGSQLSHELVREGLAWWYWKYSKDIDIAMLEAGAKVARKGIWSEDRPMAPWDFRGGGTQAASIDSETAATPTAATEHATSIVGTFEAPVERRRSSEAKEQTVYLTRTGAKYHRGGCTSLRYTSIAASKSDAQSRGFGPCHRCNP